MAYYEQRPSDAEKPPGCLDALLITRAVFGILFWPIAILLGTFSDIVLILYLFTTYAPLAIIPIAVTIAIIAWFIRWEQRRFRPPDA